MEVYKEYIRLRKSLFGANQRLKAKTLVLRHVTWEGRVYLKKIHMNNIDNIPNTLRTALAVAKKNNIGLIL